MEAGRILVLGGPTLGNTALIDGLRGLGLETLLVAPAEVRSVARRDDVAIARLDVLPTLDGIEDGLGALVSLERAGIRVINSPPALRAMHDKLRTARLLLRAGLPHPRTEHVVDARALLALQPPLVLKPRYGSWGYDVLRCRDRGELLRGVAEVRRKRWFTRQGVLVQELLPFSATDLRIVVAAGQVVGAVERRAAPDEWRTNVSLGGTVRPVEPPGEACELALQAVTATSSDLAGVDLYPVGPDWVVLELNGAVEFNAVYSLPGRDVYSDIVSALGLAGSTSVPARNLVEKGRSHAGPPA